MDIFKRIIKDAICFRKFIEDYLVYFSSDLSIKFNCHEKIPLDFFDGIGFDV
jgi:hypothetical protein